MDFYQDISKFQQLCRKYRREVAIGSPVESTKILREIVDLINFNAHRLCTHFKVKMQRRTTKLDKKRGIVLPSMSVNKILQKGDSLKMKDLTTLNPYSTKQIDGFNMILDYSGSMWFEEKKESIDGLLRIHAQNFLALVLTNYIAMTSKRKVDICIACAGEHPIITMMNEATAENIDLFLVNTAWGNLGEATTLPDTYAPLRMRGLPRRFFLSEDVNAAIKESISMFKKKKVHNFMTFFFTDGGLHRIGETGQDRLKYFEKIISMAQSVSKNTTFLFTFIKTQQGDIMSLLRTVGIKHFQINDKNQLNDCFSTFTQAINSMR